MGPHYCPSGAYGLVGWELTSSPVQVYPPTAETEKIGKYDDIAIAISPSPFDDATFNGKVPYLYILYCS
jgi:hypothetical protein